MMKRPLLWLLLVSLAGGVRADEQVRAAQEELRRRNIYFGNIDGQRSDELQEALRRYQARKGLSATGKDDRETLRSLGVVQRGPDEAPPRDLVWPEEPILKSDTPLDVAAEAREIAQTTGVAVESVAQGPELKNRRSSRRSDRQQSPTPRNNAVRNVSAPRFSPADSRALPVQVLRYVRDYTKAMAENRLEDELPFYADRVNYLGNGTVDRRIIEQSLRRYYQRWPSRSYSQMGEMKWRALPARGEIVVNFRLKFSLKNGGKRVRGQTDHEMVINAATADPRIVSITERRVRQ